MPVGPFLPPFRLSALPPYRVRLSIENYRIKIERSLAINSYG